jgi:hypothetical protein
MFIENYSCKYDMVQLSLTFTNMSHIFILIIFNISIFNLLTTQNRVVSRVNILVDINYFDLRDISIISNENCTDIIFLY